LECYKQNYLNHALQHTKLLGKTARHLN